MNTKERYRKDVVEPALADGMICRMAEIQKRYDEYYRRIWDELSKAKNPILTTAEIGEPMAKKRDVYDRSKTTIRFKASEKDGWFYASTSDLHPRDLLIGQDLGRYMVVEKQAVVGDFIYRFDKKINERISYKFSPIPFL